MSTLVKSKNSLLDLLEINGLLLKEEMDSPRAFT